MSQSIISEIKSSYGYLTKTEKVIADLLLGSPKDFITYSMAQIADIANISQGSINNFAKKFAGDGFTALKLKLAGELSSATASVPFTIINRECEIKTAMEIKMLETVEAFKNTIAINNEENLKNAVLHIINAKRIMVCGMYYSGLTAQTLSQRLIELGVAATNNSDMLMCAVSASMMDNNDLIIAISSSGQTREIIDTVELAKKNGVPVLIITSNKYSKLAAIADCILITASSGITKVDRIDEIVMSQGLIVDTLCTYIRCLLDGNDSNKYEKLVEVMGMHSIEG